MAIEFKHEKTSLKECMGVGVEDMPWIEDLFKDYVANNIKFSEMLENLITKLRTDSFGEQNPTISEYEIKLMMGGFMLGGYFSSFKLIYSDLLKNPIGLTNNEK